MKNDPFYPGFEMKPKWLSKEAHVPRCKNLQKQAKELVESAKSGAYRALVIASGTGGRGMTHFLQMELIPALESEGSVCMETSAFSYPTNPQLREHGNLQEITSKLATPADAGLLDAESLRWVSEGEQKAQKWMEYRKREKIPVEPRSPYLPKILSQSIDSEEKRKYGGFEEDEYEGGPGLPNYQRLRDNRRKELGNFHSLCSLAMYNGKALCAYSEISIYLNNSKRENGRLYYDVKRMVDPYAEPCVIRLICIQGVSGEKLEKECETAPSSVVSAALEPAGKAWTTQMIMAHQKASKKEWLARASVEKIAEKFAGRPQSALWFCRVLARKAVSLPISEDDVNKELVNKRWENDRKAFQMEF